VAVEFKKLAFKLERCGRREVLSARDACGATTVRFWEAPSQSRSLRYGVAPGRQSEFA